jgi:hypothetical protein
MVVAVEEEPPLCSPPPPHPTSAKGTASASTAIGLRVDIV